MREILALKEICSGKTTIPAGAIASVPRDVVPRLCVRGFARALPPPEGSCRDCGRLDYWTSTTGVIICRVCHPPMDGAEELFDG